MTKLAAKLNEVIALLGGRKYALTIFVLLLLTSFGVFCVLMEVELAGASIYAAVIAAKSFGYLQQNVKQKNGKASTE